MSDIKYNNINENKSNEINIENNCELENNVNLKNDDTEKLKEENVSSDEVSLNSEKLENEKNNSNEALVNNKEDENKEYFNNEEVLCNDKVEQEILNCEVSKSEDEGKCEIEKNELEIKNELKDVEAEDEIESAINESKEKVINEQLNEDNLIDKYKYQIEEDILVYERNLLTYKDWVLKGKELVLKSMKTFDNINFIIEKFNEEISKKLEVLNDEDKKLIENRVKGINMINKMSKNSINNGLNKLSDKEEVDFSNIKIVNEFDNKNEDEIRLILNQNYSNISHVESEKLNLISKYFNYIEGNLLPIIDGVESGISFVKSSTNEIIENEILPIYMELKKSFHELLASININKIELKLKTKIDFTYTEVLDIQETEEDNLDETIESIVRNGYEYCKDIYGVGHNHIIRQAQIVAYKVYSKK